MAGFHEYYVLLLATLGSPYFLQYDMILRRYSGGVFPNDSRPLVPPELSLFPDHSDGMRTQVLMLPDRLESMWTHRRHRDEPHPQMAQTTFRRSVVVWPCGTGRTIGFCSPTARRRL